MLYSVYMNFSDKLKTDVSNFGFKDGFFTTWSPSAKKVSLLLYKTFDDVKTGSASRVGKEAAGKIRILFLPLSFPDFCIINTALLLKMLNMKFVISGQNALQKNLLHPASAT